jgi:hypothetical protein
VTGLALTLNKNSIQILMGADAVVFDDFDGLESGLVMLLYHQLCWFVLLASRSWCVVAFVRSALLSVGFW